jgi:hypothetical protein
VNHFFFKDGFVLLFLFSQWFLLFFISTCSPELLDWFINGRVVCGLPMIHTPKKPWDHFENCRGISPVLGFQIWPKLESLDLNGLNRSERRGISLVPGFQFWLKSESLGLSGTQPQ